MTLYHNAKRAVERRLEYVQMTYLKVTRQVLTQNKALHTSGEDGYVITYENGEFIIKKIDNIYPVDTVCGSNPEVMKKIIRYFRPLLEQYVYLSETYALLINNEGKNNIEYQYLKKILKTVDSFWDEEDRGSVDEIERDYAMEAAEFHEDERGWFY